MRFAQSLRRGQISPKPKKHSQPNLVVLLDDVYDTYNVGGIYRVADSAGVGKVYHCGATPSGPNPKISRAAVGLDQYLPHESVKNTVLLIKQLQKQGFTIIALEQSPSAKLFNKINYSGKIALLVGNESFGLSQEVLKLAEVTIELPMYGINKSLNVVVAAGIALYQIRSSLA